MCWGWEWGGGGGGRIYREVCTYVQYVCTYVCGDTMEGKSNCWHVVVARGHVKFMYIIAVVMLHGKRSQE